MTHADIFTFVVMNVVAGIILYFGRTIYPKKLPREWIIFSSGFAIYGFSRLFEILELGTTINHDFIASIVLDIIAGIQIIIGIVLVLRSQKRELMNLRKRQEEIKAIMEKLKEKFMRGHIKEEEAQRMFSSLYKELAEIEVEMEKKNK